MRAGARFVALIAAVGACRATGASPPAEVGGSRDPCLIPAREAFNGTATIGTQGTIDVANLQRGPRSPADSLVFVHLYETLVNVTCDGRLVPALAERWSSRTDTSGRVWTLYLRAAADPGPVNPEDVVDAWRSRRSAPGSERDPRALAVEAVAIESDRALTVRFRDPHRDGPRVLADPYFAVHRASPDPNAMRGTGPFALLHADDSLPSDGSLTLTPPFGVGGGTRTLRVMPSDDPRDLIDRGVNVLRTRDRRTIAYAATRQDSRTQPLPADRAYVLVAPARPVAASGMSPSAGAADTTSYAAVADPRWESLRAALSRDVLRERAPQRTDSWWLMPDVASRCEITVAARAPWTSPRSATRSPRLVFAGRDSIGAALARRLVVLGAADAPPSPEARAVRELLPELASPASDRIVASGVSDADLASGLLTGADAAYLVALPRRVVDACAHWRTFSAMVPWVRPGDVAFIIESAPVLITNAGAPALTIDWIGTLRVVGPARTASPDR